MNKRERLQATVDGQAVDRPAVALWRHWPGDDMRPADLAAAHVAWQEAYDFDLVKMMPTSAYCLHDWGIQTAWLGADEGTRTYQSQVIRHPADWSRLPLLDPHAGSLGQALEAVRLVVAALGAHVPVIMTIFSPLAQAKNLAGPHLLSHLRQHPDAVLAGIETIAESTRRFVEALKPLGVDGIFYAAQLADAERLTRDEYRRFGTPFDLRILQGAGDWWFNMLHIHGVDVYFDLFVDYPVQAINWHDRESGPTLAQAAGQFGGALSGGLDRWTVHRGTPDQVRTEAADAIAQTGGRRLILSTGCVAMTNSPLSNLRAARAAVGS